MAQIKFEEIIRRSTHLTWKNKWLWVYALVLGAATGGSSGNFNSLFSGDSSFFENIQRNDTKDLPEKTSQVLGAATNAISQWISAVPVTTWVLLVIGLVFLVILAMVVGLVVQSFAKGSLISGLEKADKGEKVTLKNSSLREWKAIKNLIYYGVISTTIILLVVLLFSFLALIVAMLSLFLGSGAWFLLIPVGATGVIAFVVVAVVVAMVGVFAERLVILKGYSPWQAWKKGLSLTRGNLLNVVILAIINGVAGCVVSSLGCFVSLFVLLLLLIPGLALFGLGALAVSAKAYWLLVPVGLGALLLFMIFSAANIALRAGLIVFNFSNWNLFFKQVMEEEK